MKISTGIGLICGMVSIWFLSGYFANNGVSARKTLRNGSDTYHKNAFILHVNLEFDSVEDKLRFKQLFIPMAQYVRTKEPTTLSYIVADSDKDPKKVIIVERYIDKSAYTDIHRTSNEFLAFREQFQTFTNLKINGESYIETDVGFY